MNLKTLAPLTFTLFAASLPLQVPAAFGADQNQPPQPNQIVIRSKHSGWGSQDEEMTIVRKKSGYEAFGKPIEGSLINDLVATLDNPIVPEISITNMGVNPEWIKSNEAQLTEGLTEKKRALLLKKIRDRDFLEKAVKENYSMSHTDDYSDVEVKFKFENSVTTLTSASQQDFMLPWHISMGLLSSKTTYDARIGRAVAALLPDKFANKDRLAGKHLAQNLATGIKDGQLRADLDSIGADEEVGSQILPIKKRFSVSGSAVHGESGCGYDVFGWHGKLTGGSIPTGFEVEAHLTQSKKKLASAGEFLSGVDRYVSLAASPNWLRDWLLNNTSARAQVQMVDGKSTTQKLRADLVSDLNKNGLGKLAEIVEKQLDASTFMTVNQGDGVYSRWLVLPDHRMLLWHAKGNRVLKWAREQLPKSWEYFGHRGYGAMVESSGEFQKQP